MIVGGSLSRAAFFALSSLIPTNRRYIGGYEHIDTGPNILTRHSGSWLVPERIEFPIPFGLSA
ncbi:MAG: hypothetical protein CMB79_24490 [Filomicrobium sp.]|nr:hypothetical protein [Filomicrobium sp.]MAI48929.1 hypothetical protein [Filomicrobium sp.]